MSEIYVHVLIVQDELENECYIGRTEKEIAESLSELCFELGVKKSKSAQAMVDRINSECQNTQVLYFIRALPPKKDDDPTVLKEWLAYIDARKIREPRGLITRLRKRLKRQC